MKKLLSITFALLILLSGLHITVATHFCGEEMLVAKVSVSGELATCGMEDGLTPCSAPVKIGATSCCKDKVSAFLVDSNYAPSYTLSAKIKPLLVKDYGFQASLESHFKHSVSLTYSSNSPPGLYCVSAVSLPTICVFRI